MTAVLICTIAVAALLVILITVEAIRTGRWELGGGGVADRIPDGFYSDSLLPDALLDGAGWIVFAAIVWIVVAALLAASTSARRRTAEHRDPTA
ncbi:hypothetical protein [Gulosibacter sp. 10]|uniref:hypothetical protein n=1 Tax=Gulosibacter sp. 10 TaxID=1255570 RepID=UPI00097EA80D|nr:hypothetical protein [Gulosibacter sp. 10]SJM58059.1 hypothetical protein FM112_05625 [Gulosibacter sp. 10]